MERMALPAGEGPQKRGSAPPLGDWRVGRGRGLGRRGPSLLSSRLEVAEDEELTSLNWLHESKDLLMAMSLDGRPLANPLPAQPKEKQPLPVAEGQAKPRETKKPPYSWNSLIFMAIEGSPRRCLPVKEIYKWILQQYPYFKRAPGSWKNSVRQNLSLNRCFRRVVKCSREALGKGSFWSVDREFRPSLLQAIRKRNLRLHSPSLSSSATVQQNPSYSQNTAGQGQDQPPVSSQVHSITPALLPDATNTITSGESAQTNSRDLAPRPVWGDVCLTRHAPAVCAMPNGDHNYSLARNSEWQVWPPGASGQVQEQHRTVSAKVEREGDEGSEGFVSGSESETEDEGAEDSLADSGYIPLGVQPPCATEGLGGSPCLGEREALGFSDIDEELHEVAGSLLNLAGIHS
ncbi:forkhead box protein N2-like [Pristis pectinata]|uniref:forkhead box protein N2-like n=1 Tax=Pristis pectinata TaxID=685728 RepID=UPI00223CD567|nr:forkhead box protein N2-like [Pristis pectinata]XP_051901120.1 forkhead box protein N2-like [Pristis pectinata]